MGSNEGNGQTTTPALEETATREKQLAFFRRLKNIKDVPPSGIFQFYTHFDMVRQFHVAADGKGNCYIGTLKTPPPLEILEARYRIIMEEFMEEGGVSLLRQMASGEKAITLENIAVLADWIADMEYFFHGLAVVLGIPGDTVFLHVHDANMRKVVTPDGAIFREDGKVLKPEGWVGPEKPIFDAIQKQHLEDTAIDPHQLPQSQ